MKTIKMQVTHTELCLMLEGMDKLLQAYHKVRVNTKDIEKVRAHIVRKLLMMEREMKKNER